MMKKSIVVVMISLFFCLWIESVPTAYGGQLSNFFVNLEKLIREFYASEPNAKDDIINIIVRINKNPKWIRSFQAALSELSNDDRIIINKWLESRTTNPSLQDDPVIKMVDKAYKQAQANATNSKEELESKVNEVFKEEAKSDSAFTFEPPCTIKINGSLYKSTVLKVVPPSINYCSIGKTLAAVAVCDAYDCVKEALDSEPKIIRKEGEIFRDELSDKTEGPKMVVIPEGEFWMGSEKSEKGRNSDERRHWVKIKSFAIGQYEVTFQEYDRFCEAKGREKPGDEGWGRGRRPVINVSWHDAVAYADWLSQITDKRYRLLTEAEWEYAARANTETAYWWGNEVSSNNANCNDCGSQWDNKQTAPVAQFKANEFKLHDTAGNVYEWTCSGYSKDYDGSELKCVNKDDKGPRMVRGGSWDDEPRRVRGAARNWDGPLYGGGSVGFRLARDL